VPRFFSSPRDQLASRDKLAGSSPLLPLYSKKKKVKLLNSGRRHHQPKKKKAQVDAKENEDSAIKLIV